MTGQGIIRPDRISRLRAVEAALALQTSMMVTGSLRGNPLSARVFDISWTLRTVNLWAGASAIIAATVESKS